jgi:hypothetical protein
MAVNLLFQHPVDNKAASGTLVVQSGVEDVTYPAANLADLNPALPAKLTTTTGAWTWDFGAAQRIDLVALIHHNLDAGLSVRIQANATNSWGAPTFDQAITIPAVQNDLYPTNAYLDLTGLSGYSTGGFQWWRLVVVGTNSVVISIGEVWLGALKRSLSPNISWGINQETERKLVEHSTDFGVTNIFDLGVTVRSLKGEVDTTDAGRVIIEAWWRAARGRVLMFLIVPYGDATEPWLVRFGLTTLVETFDLIDRNTIPLEFLEVGRGLRP